MTITIDDQGRITVPREIRTRLGWKSGSKLDFHVNADGELILSAEVLAKEEAISIDRFQEADDLIWRGTTDQYMAWLRDGGPEFFDARRPGEKTFSETVAKNLAAFVKMRDAMRDEA